MEVSINSFLILTTLLVGFFGMLCVWIYLWETAQSMRIIDYVVYQKYVNAVYLFSVIMLVAMWVTTTGMDKALMACFWILTLGWILTAIFSLVISTFLKIDVENKLEMRRAILPCIVRAIIMIVLLWVVY